MDRVAVWQAIGVAQGTPLMMTHLEWLNWGRDVRFQCYAALSDDALLRFNLLFEDCREMRWQIYSHMPLTDSDNLPPTSWSSFKQGRDQHRSPARLLTDHFGLIVFYGALVLEVGDKRIAL